jgi:hypothetical protein
MVLWGTTMTNESYIHEGVKNTLNLRDAWFNPVQNISSFCRFLQLEIFVCKNNILLIPSCASFTLWEGHFSDRRVEKAY